MANIRNESTPHKSKGNFAFGAGAFVTFKFLQVVLGSLPVVMIGRLADVEQQAGMDGKIPKLRPSCRFLPNIGTFLGVCVR